MRTLRELLSVTEPLVVSIQGAPSYIHDWESFDENDDSITFTWTDGGLDYEETYNLDELPPSDMKVCKLVELR